jgi:tRNA (guanine37-N1)-methyltransferase
MKIDIITLFPDMFKGPFDMSMLWKAQDRKLVTIQIHDLRQFGLGTRRTVDDTPYGGGDGMVLKPEPLAAAIEEVKKHNLDAPVIFLTPVGEKFIQPTAEKLAAVPGMILVAGHYEGFDERAYSLADLRLSIGDYVLTGGELPAMVLVDSVVRLIPGVLGGEQSAHDESFSQGILEYPHYTRPVEWQGMAVPEVLQNGHHGEIEKWRREQARDNTQKFRPDLFD